MHGRRRKMRGSLFLCFALLTSLRKPHIAGWYGSHALPPCPLLHFYFSWILPISFLRDIHFISRSNLLLQTANINNQLRATCNLYNYFSLPLPTALLYLYSYRQPIRYRVVTAQTPLSFPQLRKSYPGNKRSNNAYEIICKCEREIAMKNSWQ